MLAAAARGDLVGAAKGFQRKAPLAAILGRICDQPCVAVCKRGEMGGAIEIGKVERACVEHGGLARPSSHIIRRDETVAVVGGGLSGLTAAGQLARKGYRATLFDSADALGGRLRLYPPEVLPPEILEAEITSLRSSGVELLLGQPLGSTDGALTLADLLDQYQAVCLCIGWEDCLAQVQAVAPETDVTDASVDPVTLATPVAGVFCSCSADCATAAYSPVAAVAAGVRLVTSVDRFLKNEPLAAGRAKEGPHATALQTNVAGIEPLPPVIATDNQGRYTAQEAALEAARCLQCECLECVKACTYLQHFKEYPGACIRKVTKNMISVPGKSFRTFTPFINACSLCGLCGAVCPTDLDMSVVNGPARRIMCDQGLMPPAVHHFALEDMRHSNSDSSAFARNQPGHDQSAHLFFPGCQLAASLPDKVMAAYDLLTTRLAGGVGVMTGCCGAPALWSGRQVLYEQTIVDIEQRWKAMGEPRVILACPTCELMLQQGLPRAQTVSLWQVLDELEPPAHAALGHGGSLALHDSCTARTNQAAQDAARSLVLKCGYRLEELPYSRERTKCCGYGGLMYAVAPGVAKKVVASRIDESPLDYATYCSNCRDLFARQGKTAYHLLELLFEAHEDGAAPRPGPTFSQRRANRRVLAQTMLATYWGERMPPPLPHAELRLHLIGDLAAKMEREFMTEDDVREVIDHAERTGEKLMCPPGGRFVAHHRPSLVTYWVEYAPAGEAYEVFNVYSHRMQIADEGERRGS